MAGGYTQKGIFEMWITGVDESIRNLSRTHRVVQRAVRKELRDLGPMLLADLKDETPFITGHLRDSAYFNMGNMTFDEDFIIECFLGYTASYAPIVELRRGMLSNILDRWNDEVSNRVLNAGINALEALDMEI
jgi:hypothetical protein